MTQQVCCTVQRKPYDHQEHISTLFPRVLTQASQCTARFKGVTAQKAFFTCDARLGQIMVGNTDLLANKNAFAEDHDHSPVERSPHSIQIARVIE
jgi:hypothetical protein